MNICRINAEKDDCETGKCGYSTCQNMEFHTKTWSLMLEQNYRYFIIRVKTYSLVGPFISKLIFSGKALNMSLGKSKPTDKGRCGEK